MERSRLYFVADAHLGFPSTAGSLDREKKLVRWLDTVSRDASAIYLLGDIFDFWFEYRRVVPAGFNRLLGKIAEITDSGIPVHFFCGNHDIWIFDHLPRETGIILHRDTLRLEFASKKLFLSHGDGLGPGDGGYKIIRRIFTSTSIQWLFSRLVHPDFAIRLGHRLSNTSRLSKENHPFLGEEKEQLLLFAKEVLQGQHVDYFVFGHRHLAIDHPISESSRVILLGDWLYQFSYAVFDGTTMELKNFP